MNRRGMTERSTTQAPRTLFFFEKPSAMRQLQRLFKSPSTICVAAEGHLLAAKEPGDIRTDWKSWRFDTLPIVLDQLPVTYGSNRSGQSHKSKVDGIKQALHRVDRVIIATDPGREGSMIAWEVLEYLGYRGRIDRLKLGALDETSIRRAFAAMAKEPDSGERDYAAYLEALCRQYEDYHLGLNGTRAASLRLRPHAFREPWRFGGVQTPTLAILADLERRIRDFVPQDYFKVALLARTESGADVTLWHAPKEKILDKGIAETIREAAEAWSGPLGVEQKDVRRAPPKLFSKDTLARRCAKRFGWDPQRTAKLAQELYDQGYLSYPRTESEHLPDGQIGDAGAVIERILAALPDLARVAPEAVAGDLTFRKGSKGHYVKDPGEHHAIVPLRKVPIAGGGGSVGSDHLRLWELVAKSFLAAHLSDGVDARTTIAVQVATPLGPKRFAISGSVIKSPGWRAVYGAEAEEDAAEAVPGKAKAEEEPTMAGGRLPPVRDGEPGHATEARIETAKTEPPRRITRGELPVVMGRLIDQVEDPALKAALENPVNPNEPKGLGTAATRDTILPKLLKSQYVALLKGRDPPVEVTEVGLAFIAAVRRVFPAYGDPVGRATFEAELAEIGRAATRDEALRRAASFKERTRTRLRELIDSVAQCEVVAVDPAAVPPATGQWQGQGQGRRRSASPSQPRKKGERWAASGSGDSARPPTEAMLRFAQSLARENGIDSLPSEVVADFSTCKAFLDEHARNKPGAGEGKPKRSSGHGSKGRKKTARPPVSVDESSTPRSRNGDERKPTDPMVRFARKLAQERGVAIPPGVLDSFQRCKEFLDQHASRRG
jgi:DNA topoisomerase-3